MAGLLLPPKESPVRELFDMHHLAELCSPENRGRLEPRSVVLKRVRDQLNDGVVVKIAAVCRDPDGSIILIQVSRREWQQMWDFGNPDV